MGLENLLIHLIKGEVLLSDVFVSATVDEQAKLWGVYIAVLLFGNCFMLRYIVVLLLLVVEA